jgi:hypothetical protein
MEIQYWSILGSFNVFSSRSLSYIELWNGCVNDGLETMWKEDGLPCFNVL